jgi:hypothetical protein
MTWSFKTSADFRITTRRYIPEDRTLQYEISSFFFARNLTPWNIGSSTTPTYRNTTFMMTNYLLNKLLENYHNCRDCLHFMAIPLSRNPDGRINILRFILYFTSELQPLFRWLFTLNCLQSLIFKNIIVPFNFPFSWKRLNLSIFIHKLKTFFSFLTTIYALTLSSWRKEWSEDTSL